MAEKVKEVAIGEAERIKSLTTDAARSGAYLYPLRVRIPLLPQPGGLGTRACDSCTVYLSLRPFH